MLYCGMHAVEGQLDSRRQGWPMQVFSTHLQLKTPGLGHDHVPRSYPGCPGPMFLLWVRHRLCPLRTGTASAPLLSPYAIPLWLCLFPEGAFSLGFRLQSRLRWGQGGTCGCSTAIPILLLVLFIFLLRLRCICQKTSSRQKAR